MRYPSLPQIIIMQRGSARPFPLSHLKSIVFIVVGGSTDGPVEIIRECAIDFDERIAEYKADCSNGAHSVMELG